MDAIYTFLENIIISLRGFSFDVFLQTLPVVLKGLIGIFLVTGAIILAMSLLSKLTSKKK
jgi:hypothetical protein